MEPKQIGNFNTGKSGLLLALVLILSPISAVKAMLSKRKD